jgi:hypothetical protein
MRWKRVDLALDRVFLAYRRIRASLLESEGTARDLEV